jgi:predicted LPLAT superfamily acyltransferase
VTRGGPTSVEGRTAGAGWLDVAEAGTLAGIRFFVGLVRFFGRPVALGFLHLVVLYYVLTHRTARRASREYLSRVGIRPTFGAVYRHVLCFGRCAVDRLFFARGNREAFDVRTHGAEHLERLHATGQGAVLLGSHLGSFQALCSQGDAESLRIHIVGDFRNARRINQVLEQLDPGGRARLLDARPDDLGFVLRIRELVEEGDLVAILADRVRPASRSVTVPFLGGQAPFPAGPFLLASALKCPVYLIFGVYRGGNRYDLRCEPFAERIDLPRRGRDATVLEPWVRRYAERLEERCKDAPYNWFNFYDFWEQG